MIVLLVEDLVCPLNVRLHVSPVGKPFSVNVKVYVVTAVLVVGFAINVRVAVSDLPLYVAVTVYEPAEEAVTEFADTVAPGAANVVEDVTAPKLLAY